jgi:hypothetical protein
MSFKIFSLQLTGKLKPVEKIEEKRLKLEKDYQEYIQVEKSDELQEFIQLEGWIKSEELKKEKQRISALQFKGSKEGKQLEEFVKLGKQKSIKNYFKVEGSGDLKRFNEFEKTEKLKRYEELVTFVEKGEYQNEKKKIQSMQFKGSVEEKKLAELKKLQKSAGIKAFNEINNSTTIQQYNEFEKSEKLKKYETLKTATDSEKQKEFKPLKKDAAIKSHFKFQQSKKYKLYLQTKGSSQLETFEKLQVETKQKEFLEKVNYLKDKKKFEKTEAYKQFLEYKNLKADADIKFYFNYKKSGFYKNYLNVANSVELKRFEELKKITASKEFLDRKAYLEDKNKWEKTEEHKKELKYAEMKKFPHLVNYFKYKTSSDFDFFRKWEITLEEQFNTPQIDTEKWLTKSVVADKLLGENYSLPGDLHVFTNDGSNLKLNNKLSILVKKEKQRAKVWNVSTGFVETELNYTSGTLSSGKSFWQEDGIFEAKIKFAPVKNVVSSFFLSGEANMPRITLLEMGEKNRIGISSFGSDGKLKVDGMDISNLKKDHSYIFTLEKNSTEITWKINEVELFKTSTTLFKEKLQMNANSIVIDEIQGSQLPVSFDVEWIKCYHKK